MLAAEKYYKGYYMITAKCNLSCSYCVLENSESQIKREISLDQKKRLIQHLYENFNFRSLTISGGEALLSGNNGCLEFLSLTEYLKQFKMSRKEDNLQLHLYTNGLNLNEMIANSMAGVFDEISINIDSSTKRILRRIGRNTTSGNDYLGIILSKLKLLSDTGIRIKLHTVISAVNSNVIGREVLGIYKSIVDANIAVSNWKFYQYMSYDVPETDQTHQITSELFHEIRHHIQENLSGSGLGLHFKDNKEMKESIFNILPYGNAQYLTRNDTWSTSRRTKQLWEYTSVDEMFNDTKISRALFDKFHLTHM